MEDDPEDVPLDPENDEPVPFMDPYEIDNDEDDSDDDDLDESHPL